jgi:hypothetical protein
MEHLTEEQFEGILQGEDDRVCIAHLEECDDCRNRLKEKRAITGRLRTAFASIKASSVLAERIRSRLNTATEPAMTAQPIQDTHLGNHIKRLKRLWPTFAAAAAVLLILVPLSLYFGAPSSAEAAQAELVRIHKENLAADHEFMSEADPEKLAAYFKDKLGFNPRLPELDRGMALRGCCVRHFRGRIVGSYVVDTPEGVMSIIVVTDKPESLGISSRFAKDQQTYWKSSFAKCNMVSVRIGNYTYCAVDEISHEYLAELLSRLVPEGQG